MSRFEERKRAAELRALDARQLVQASLPTVVSLLNTNHLDHLQRVLDAAAINADVQKRWEELDRQSIKGKIVHSSEYLRDPAAVARRDKVLSEKVVVGADENAVRLDFRKLLGPGALKPTSDNPDEAGYLLLVMEIYDRFGVWLVLEEGRSEMARNLSPNDPRRWLVRLLLGYKRGALVEEIQADRGTLTRKALLSVTRLGAGYYEWVHRGPTLTALHRAIEGVSSQITTGRGEHFWWSAHRDEFRIVSRVSDKLGGAVWPNESIWEQPHYSLLQARNLVNSGRLIEAAKFAQLAAIQTEWNARAIHEYIDATTRGASRAVTILKVAVVCGKISETILNLLMIGRGVLALLSRRGAASAAEAGAQRQLTGGQRQLPAPAEPASVPRSEGGTLLGPGSQGASSSGPLPGALRRQPTAMTDTGRDLYDAIDYARQQIGLPPVPEKTLAKAFGMSKSLEYKQLYKEFMDWLLRNPNATLAEKNARLERVIQSRWGAPSPTN